MSDLIFVYGSLCSTGSHPMHQELKRLSSFVDRAQVHGKLYLAEFPAAVFCTEGEGWVHGELYHFTNEVELFAALDAWEGCTPSDPEPHEYKRILVDAVSARTGETLPVWAYEYALSLHNLPLIAHGDWEKYQAERVNR